MPKPNFDTASFLPILSRIASYPFPLGGKGVLSQHAMDATTQKTGHYGALLRLGLPIIIGQLGIIFVSFTDNIMVGQHSTAELAAASFVNNILGLLLILGIGFAYGLTPLVASAEHRGQYFKAGILLRHSLRLNIAIGLFLAGVAAVMVPLFDTFNLPPSLRPLAIPYYWVQVGGLFLVTVFNAFKQFYDGMSDTRTPMYITISGNLFNVGLNYLLIFGKGGLPEMGLLGAGYATLLSRLLMLVTIVLFLYRRPSWTAIRHAFCRQMHIRRAYRRLFSVGLPVAVQMGLESASFTIAVLFVGRLGDQALAAHQIVCVITTLGYLVYYGLGAATTIRISHFKLHGKPDEVRRVAATAYRMAALTACVVVVLLLLTRHSFSFLFTPDEEVAHIVALTLIPVVVYQFGDALQAIYSNALRGMERVRFLAPAAAFCHVLLAPILSYLLGFVFISGNTPMQLAGIWSAFPISLTLLGILFYSYFRKVTR